MEVPSKTIWNSISDGLPAVTPEGLIPIPEILRVIKYLVYSSDNRKLAVDLLGCISNLRTDIEFLNWKSMVEYDAGEYEKSLDTLQKIIQQYKNENILHNAGKVAFKANRLEQSKTFLSDALSMAPNNGSVALDYEKTLSAMGDFKKSFEVLLSIDKSTVSEHEAKVIDLKRGWYNIKNGNFKEGIKLLRTGRDITRWGSYSRQYDKPQWNGTTHIGKTILIVGEGGVGDQVINARFSELIKNRGMDCVMATSTENISMLSSIKTLDLVFDHDDIEKHDWDYWVPCIDLPVFLDIDSSEIPSNPYIHAKPEFVEKWKSIISNNNCLKVGIRWAGNPNYEQEVPRTIPFHLFETLNMDKVQLYSLQTQDTNLPTSAIDISDQLTTWDDTMGAIMNLDLVISSCTGVVHVSAALGCPTWAVVPILPYYIWADNKSSSYWYDSVKVYRQQTWGKWDEPMNKVYQDLKFLKDSYV